MDTQEKIEYIADYYGWDKQYMMVVEEMSELTKAICKHRRMWGRNPEGHLIPSRERDAMLEEAADVQVMLYQAAYLLRAEEEIGRIVEEKLDRQIGIIGEEKGKKHAAGVYPLKDDMPRYKGFLILKCQHCGKIHDFCAKYSIAYLKCRECGRKTELSEPLNPAYVNCDCGRSSRYLTNLTDTVIEVGCVSCHKPIDLEWNGKKKCYQTIREG